MNEGDFACRKITKTIVVSASVPRNDNHIYACSRFGAGALHSIHMPLLVDVNVDGDVEYNNDMNLCDVNVHIQDDKHTFCHVQGWPWGFNMLHVHNVVCISRVCVCEWCVVVCLQYCINRWCHHT